MHEDHRSSRANASLDTTASLDQINQSMLGKAHQYITGGITNRHKIIDHAVAM